MVFSRNKPERRLSTDASLNLSDWEDAPTDEQVAAAPDTEAVTGVDVQPEERAPAAPELNLHNVYSAIQRKDSTHSNEDCEVQVSRSTKSSKALMKSAISQRSFGFRRKSFEKDKDEELLTVAPSSSASRSSYTSSACTNIWTKLLGGHSHEGLWDGLNSKNGNAYDAADADFLDEGDDGDEEVTCTKSMKRCGLAWWYETKHFFKTVIKHPHIWIMSACVFGVLCAVGMMAINAEKDKYVQKQKGTAEFVAQETAEWFSNEFRRAMLPLYSVQQGVIHSGYFDDLNEQIGHYPNRLIPESEETPFTKRDVSGICDNQDMIDKWRSIVQPINAENDLDGVVVGYRLFPNNVACLTEPHAQESNEHFNSEAFPQGEALLASDNVMGLDTGHTGFPLWKMITTDLFVNKNFNIFGPFAMPPMSELICGHLPIWTKPEVDPKTGEEMFDPESALDVHGTKVDGAWGFVVNFLDWTKLKDKSNIYKRFSDCNLEFELSRVSGSTVGIDKALLAESPNSSLLNDDNSIVVETNSLHGVWQNRVGSLSGWSPPWYPAAVAGVVLTSLLLALLTASTLVERQLHRNLLYKVMPARAIAKLHRGQTVLEKYNLVTIFFSDIVGFTSMSGQMRPIQVMKMLNELYTEFDKLVDKHQVYKVETIGDAYMVVGGAPDRVSAPLAAERVALFALDAINFVKNFRTQDGDQIFIRAGLASGPTVAGVVGQAMPRYCFFGDTVNFASRMESTSKKMLIQCAEITYRLLKDAPNMNFGLKKRMEDGVAGVQIKGKGHQVTYWIENSNRRDPNQKVTDSVPHSLPKVNEAEEVSEDATDVEMGNGGTDISSRSNESDVGYKEFLKVIKQDK